MRYTFSRRLGRRHASRPGWDGCERHAADRSLKPRLVEGLAVTGRREEGSWPAMRPMARVPIGPRGSDDGTAEVAFGCWLVSCRRVDSTTPGAFVSPFSFHLQLTTIDHRYTTVGDMSSSDCSSWAAYYYPEIQTALPFAELVNMVWFVDSGIACPFSGVKTVPWKTAIQQFLLSLCHCFYR